MKPSIKKPVIIIGCPRSGTTLLFTILSQSPELFSLFNESRFIFKNFYLNKKKENIIYHNDELKENDLDEKYIDLLLNDFHKYSFNNKYLGLGLQKIIRKQSLLKPFEELIIKINSSIKNSLLKEYRLVEKTPRNCFKVLFLNKLFPDAKYIFLTRDGKTNISSLIDGWQKRKSKNKRFPQINKPLNIKGYSGTSWHFVLPPEWENYSEETLEKVCAFQWVSSNETALRDFEKLDKNKIYKITYEELSSNPGETIKNICNFIEIEFKGNFKRLAENPPVVNTFSKPSKDKWKKNSSLIENILPIIEPTMKNLGYKSLIFIFLFFLSSFLIGYADTGKKDILHFIHLSDTHINHDDYEDKAKIRMNSSKMFLKTIEQINNLNNIDFILDTGDVINKPEKHLLEKFINLSGNLKYPLYIILGNHDVGVNAEISKLDYLKKHNELNPITSFPELMSYYTFYPKENIAFICLDTTNEETVSRFAFIPEEQLAWFKNELEKNKDKIVFVAIHVPPIPPWGGRRSVFEESNRLKILDLINSYKNVIGIFSGDYHIARLFENNNKIYSIAPATVKYPCGFREVIVYKAEKSLLDKWRKRKGLLLDFKWHTIDEPELVKYSKQRTLGKRNAAGKLKDRENIFKVYY